MSPLVSTILISLAAVLAAMFVLWLISLPLKNASIVDPFWPMGFVVIAWLGAVWNDAWGIRQILMLGLVTLWGGRLGVFLLWRNMGHGEDSRYVAMRDKHGSRFARVSLVTVFLLQGFLMWFIAFPIQAIMAGGELALSWLDVVGVGVWGVGLFFETVGDWQLACFKGDPKNDGKVLDRGLWRYTRHPNYFGDFCVWWGIFCVAAAGGAGWTIASCLLMTVLLLKVSGVALLEKTIGTRRPAYADYVQRTNAFFPGPPRLR